VVKELFSDASLLIATDFRGMSVGQMVGLRRALRASGGRYRVVKSTLARLAAEGAARPAIKEILEGPVGLVITDEDPVATARSLIDHLRNQRLEMGVGRAVLGAEIISEDRVRQLAALPPRQELISRLLGQMNAPIAGLVTVLSGPVRGLVTVLQRHAEQLGGEPATASES